MPEPKKLSAVNQTLLYFNDYPGSSAKEIIKSLRHEGVREHSVNNAITVGKKAGFLEHVGHARYRLTDLAKSHMARIMAGDNPTVPTPGSPNFKKLHAQIPTMTEITGDIGLPLKELEIPEPSIREETINWLMEYRGVTNRLLDILEKFASNSGKGGE